MTRQMIKIAYKAKENTFKTRKKTEINTKVFKVKQKVRESICIRILDYSIFAKIQPLNKYSKLCKKEMWLTKDWLYIQGWIIGK